MKTFYNVLLLFVCMVVNNLFIETTNVVMSTIASFAIAILIKDMFIDIFLDSSYK